MKNILDLILTGVGLSLLAILFALALVTSLFLYPFILIVEYFRPTQ